ncbi:MAG: YkgJ family cysteine cluster protein [Gammaproteobacteria bacterium]|nr:YkgJ family cysteine cluster protein [Gammaproteobacteria bacterium]MDH5735968.1 YkgJ family cysteine cluster protein [Gammaproteobacteria bacterium]
MMTKCDVDCNKGRELGCQTFCCRLLVRLEPDERPESKDGMPSPGFVEKTADGYCIHFNRQTGLCSNWMNRPKVCRSYSCNSDDLLQVALREQFSSLVDLVKKAQNIFIPKENYKYIPYCSDDDIG